MANVPPPAGMTRAESKARNRERLLEAARDELIEKGYAALSARSVSARAGVAQSSFYAHFRDKNDLIRTLSERIFGPLRERLRQSRRSERGGWDEMIAQTFGSLLEFFARERELLAILFQELDQPESPINAIGQEIFETIHNDLIKDLEDLMKDGHIPPMPSDAVAHMVVGTGAYLLRRMLVGRVDDPPALVTGIVELNQALLRGVSIIHPRQRRGERPSAIGPSDSSSTH